MVRCTQAGAYSARRAMKHCCAGPLVVLQVLLVAMTMSCGFDRIGPQKVSGDNGNENQASIVPGDAFVTDTASARGVVNGTTDPTVITVSAAQQLAIGALLADGSLCTATLISDTAVLSAAHCALNGDEVVRADNTFFYVGTDIDAPRAVISVRQVIVNPAYEHGTPAHDVALFILATSARSLVAGIKPIGLNTQPIDDLQGHLVQNVGFGRTDAEGANDNTRRYWTAEPIVAISDADFTVDGRGVSSVCFGDSGGPSLYNFNGLTRVLGTVSSGDDSCTGRDHYARADQNAAWIERYVSLPSDTADAASETVAAVAVDPCQGLDYEGRCAGDVAQWCEDGQIKSRNCAAFDQRCGWVDESTGYYCM
jgi:V8-like Glu-specific endopeptidase